MSSFASPQAGAYGADAYEGIAAQIAARDPTAYGYLANARARNMDATDGYRRDLLNTIMAQREAALLDASDKRSGRQIDAMKVVQQGLDPNIVTGATNLFQGVSPGVINSTAGNNIADRIAGRYKDILPGTASMRDAGAAISATGVAGMAQGRYLQPDDITMGDPASVRAAQIRADGDGGSGAKIYMTPSIDGRPPEVRVVGNDPAQVQALSEQMRAAAGETGSRGVLPSGLTPAPRNAETQRRINESIKIDPNATGVAAMTRDGKMVVQLKSGQWVPAAP